MTKSYLLPLVISLLSTILMADGIQPIGAGTESDPYQVEILDNLLWITTNPDSWDSHFIQTNDIDAITTQNWYDGDGYNPIGVLNLTSWNVDSIVTSGVPFTGSYDGQGFSISNIICNSNPQGDIIALFSYTEDATIKDVHINSLTNQTHKQTAGIVGHAIDSTIEDCSFSGSMTKTDNNNIGCAGIVWFAQNSLISRCTNDGETNSRSWYGISYYIDNTDIEYCSVNLNIDTLMSCYGFVDHCLNLSTISFCESTVNSSIRLWYYAGFVNLLNHSRIEDCVINSGAIDCAEGAGIALTMTNHSRVIDCTNNGNLYGDRRLAGIASRCFLNSVISNCINNGDLLPSQYSWLVTRASGIAISVSDSRIDYCTNNGNLNSYEGAGIVNGITSYGIIENCVNNGEIVGSTVGGIVNNCNVSNIRYCVNNGNIISYISGGGVCQTASGSSHIEECVNYGNLSHSNNGDWTIEALGGIISVIENGVSITKCINYGDIASLLKGGALIGSLNGYDINISNSYYGRTQSEVVASELCLIGRTEDYLFSEWEENGYCLNPSDYFQLSDGDSFVLSCPDDIRKLSVFSEEGYSFSISEDIDLSTLPDTFLPYFQGKIEGNGRKISSLNIADNRYNNIGFIGILNQAEITKLGVTDFFYQGNKYAGGFTSVSSNSMIENCYAKGTIDSTLDVGGFVYTNASSVSKCYSACTLPILENTSGFCHLNDGTITNSFWDMEVSGIDHSDGGEGKTNLEMRQYNTYFLSGWDFTNETVNGEENIWFIHPQVNDGYPHHIVQEVVSNNEQVLETTNRATQLIGNYPNPFNPETTIEFNSDKNQQIEITVYNIKGQKVKTVTDQTFGEGKHKVVWTGIDDSGLPVSSGYYLCRLKNRDSTDLKKLLLMQ